MNLLIRFLLTIFRVVFQIAVLCIKHIPATLLFVSVCAIVAFFYNAPETNVIRRHFSTKKRAKKVTKPDREGSLTDDEPIDKASLGPLLHDGQFYASITNKGQGAPSRLSTPVRSSPRRSQMREMPDNATDITLTTQQVVDNDPNLNTLDWSNIRHIPRETFKKLFDGLKSNVHLEKLNLNQSGLTDGPTEHLVEALKDNTTLQVLNVESNFLSGNTIRNLIESANKNQTLRELRATDQRPSIIGNRVEIEIAHLVEQNRTLRVVDLNFDVPDARVRVSQQLTSNAR